MTTMRILLIVAAVVLLVGGVVVVVAILNHNQAEQVAASDYIQRHPELMAANPESASDFYQRHPEWAWSVPENYAAVIPVTGEQAFPDYYQRQKPVRSVDTTDYYFRQLTK